MATIGTMVAVGDSFTEGLHDGTDEALVGWADRVATELARRHGGLRYANLAVRGKLLDEIVADQLDPALQMQPDLLTFHAGGNDVLRPGVEVKDILDRYDQAVARAVGAARRVLLFTALERSGPANRMADRLADRIRRFNDGVREAAARHGAVLADIGGVEALYDRRLWHADRLHLAPYGHARVAEAVLQALGEDLPDADAWRRPLPSPARSGRLVQVLDDGRWAVQHLAPWVLRRLRGVSSGDGRNAKRPELSPVEPG